MAEGESRAARAFVTPIDTATAFVSSHHGDLRTTIIVHDCELEEEERDGTRIDEFFIRGTLSEERVHLLPVASREARKKERRCACYHVQEHWKVLRGRQLEMRTFLSLQQELKSLKRLEESFPIHHVCRVRNCILDIIHQPSALLMLLDCSLLCSLRCLGSSHSRSHVRPTARSALPSRLLHGLNDEHHLRRRR